MLISEISNYTTWVGDVRKTIVREVFKYDKIIYDELNIFKIEEIHNFGIDGFLKHDLIKSKLNEG